MTKTTRGLPNTCSQCGTPVKKEDWWFANNEDEARSGQGLCEKCATTNDAPVEQEKPVDNQQPEQEAAGDDVDQEEQGDVGNAPIEQRKKRG
ncbi:MAG: hypothetical protein JXB07_18925 [Anaerolineae bacterium]|nr:hypothetical protein [Anaerolineae bacterium]